MFRTLMTRDWLRLGPGRYRDLLSGTAYRAVRIGAWIYVLYRLRGPTESQT